MDGGASPQETDRHFWLTRSVARVAGVNLMQALSHGDLTQADYAGMIESCRQGGCDGACAEWLGQQAAWPAEPPRFCAHIEILARLRQLQIPN
ncbi:DUF6455 family protein [Pseudodonghicola flavimaris]|uniref:DUF6455 family protein n=1 Tax=Pseudodonghicola flavimaris TaxID=3050036 RepID=A0ABT7EYT4_9RHOB|nr:DUF6455 family protein [Pseudodonghicola flavimaris]MDK3017505.1 DUF6455 family protein [Pseudodonghicola flavimaris]